jgi:hypothetical protein
MDKGNRKRRGISMIAYPLPTLAKAAFVALSFLAIPPALAVEDSTRVLAENQRAVESLVRLGDEVKALLTPEIGFPQEYVGAWQIAVDRAFDADRLEADFLEAFDTRLTDPARNAALAFDETPLARETYERIREVEAMEEDVDFDAVRDYLEAAPAAENALYVDIFAAQQGPERANAIMDVYFRMMKIAAEPVIGAEVADQWVAGAQDLRDGYVENYFLASVSAFNGLPQERVIELAAEVTAPDIIAYSEQAMLAFSDALNAAADRLDTAFSEEIADL